MSRREKIAKSQLVRSIVRHRSGVDRRSRVSKIASSVLLHLHPHAIRRHGLRFRFTWCMGGITALLFLIELITGVILMFYYRPTAEWAYTDILALRDSVSFGIVREIHRWGAHLMVLTVMLHMFRVFMTGSYKPPREFNWVIGVALLVLTLLLSFTGYILPFDQLSMWAGTVGTNIAGATPLVGSEGPIADALTAGDAQLITTSSDIRYLLLGEEAVGEETLNRFYVLHCIALPLLSVLLMAVHFWRVRKDGGISGPL